MRKEIPQHLLKPMEIQNSIRARSVQFIFMNLHQQFEHLKEIDIKSLKTRLSKPYDNNGKFREFTSNQLYVLNQLNIAGQPLKMDATAIIRQAYNIIDFSPCWTEFAMDHGVLAEQTPRNLCTFITTFVEERFEHHRAASLALGAANSAFATPLLPNNSIVETELSANSDNAAASAVKATKHR